MKKVLFITTNFLPSKLSGSEQFVRVVSKILKDKYEVTILTHLGKKSNYWWNPFTAVYSYNDCIDNVKIIRLKTNHFKNFCIIFFKILFRKTEKKYLKKLFSKKFIEYINLYLGPQFIGLEKFLSENKFDTIHVGPLPYEYPTQVANIIKNKLKLKSKLITTPFFHDTQEVYYSELFKNYFDLCDLIHVVSSAEKNILQKAFNIPSTKIKVIPLFLDLDDFTKEFELRKETIKYREQNNLLGKTVVLGFNGGAVETKGIEYTIRAMNSFAKTKNNLCLIVFGQKLNFNELQIDKNIKIIEYGYLSALEKDILFDVCDIFSMPSQIESFGLLYLEAWLRKKPILGFELEALKEVFDQGSVLCKIRDQKDVTLQLKKLIENKDLRNEKGLKGYKYLKEKYTSDALKKSYKELFD